MTTPMAERKQAKRVARAEFATRGFLVIVLVILAVAVVTLGQIFDNSERNGETLRVIRDCTQPSGQCYKRGQAQTAQAVADIGRYVVLAAACAADVDASQPVDRRIALITACITERLATPAR